MEHGLVAQRHGTGLGPELKRRTRRRDDHRSPVAGTGAEPVQGHCAGGRGCAEPGVAGRWLGDVLGDNTFGELGDGTDGNSRGIPGPVQKLGPIRAAAVDGGGDHSLALLADGTVWAWGENFSGNLGDGTTVNRPSPVRVRNLTGAVGVSGGAQHSLAVQ